MVTVQIPHYPSAIPRLSAWHVNTTYYWVGITPLPSFHKLTTGLQGFPARARMLRVPLSDYVDQRPSYPKSLSTTLTSALHRPTCFVCVPSDGNLLYLMEKGFMLYVSDVLDRWQELQVAGLTCIFPRPSQNFSHTQLSVTHVNIAYQILDWGTNLNNNNCCCQE